MFRKKIRNFFTYPIFLLLFLSFIGVMGFSAIVKYHYDGGKKYQLLQQLALFIAEVPSNFKKMVKYKTANLNAIPVLTKHIDKKRFVQFVENKRNALLVSSRYDYSLNRSVVDIIDLKNFETIHTYKHDIGKMNDQITNTELYSNININQTPNRFRYFDPIIFEDGSLLSHNFQGQKILHSIPTMYIPKIPHI